MKALSIKQPFAWLITNGYKDIENRSWRTDFRGDLLIHASKNRFKKNDFKNLINLLDQLGIDYFQDIPQLEYGGIVGKVSMIDCVTESNSPWFYGEYGFVFRNPICIPLIPLKGQLRFFNCEI